MKQSRRLLINALVMSASALLLRFAGVSFNVWISNRIGEAGMGLFQLISSAYLLAVTVATGGIRTATVRILSEENALRCRGGALKYCIGYALFFGLLAFTALRFSASFIAEAWIGDKRAELSLKILAYALPLIAVSSVFGGCFAARSAPALASVSLICEQIVKIGTAVIILGRLVSPDISLSCAAVVTGSVAGEAAVLLTDTVLYIFWCARTNTQGKKLPRPLKKLLGIALPLEISAAARCALSTVEHMLIPRSLRRSGLSADRALADYGLIHGMVFPVMTFPLAFFSVCAELVIPEVTKAQVRENKERIRTIVGRCLYLSLLFSGIVSAFMFIFAVPLGKALYSSVRAGRFIRIFAPLMPVMYLDTVTDGLLKGLGEHMASMRYNIADAVISVIMVVTLLPKAAVTGYIAIIYFTECFNFILSIRRLSKITPEGRLPKMRDDLKWLCGAFR